MFEFHEFLESMVFEIHEISDCDAQRREEFFHEFYLKTNIPTSYYTQYTPYITSLGDIIQCIGGWAIPFTIKINGKILIRYESPF